MKKVLSVIIEILAFIFLFLGLFLVFFDRWLFATWPNLSYDEIAFQITASISGTNSDMVIEALLKYALPAALIFVTLLLLFIYVKKDAKKRIVAIAVVFCISVCGFGFTIFDMQKRIGAVDHIKAGLSSNDSARSTFIEEHYVDPKDVEITFPEQKRNLVYIYLESMEMTYSDEANGGAFTDNYIPNLTSFGLEAQDFSGGNEELNGGVAFPGTTWTMGGMFAQTAGIPLKINVGANAMEYSDTFFPDMGTLGDVLEEAGYKNYLAIGSEAVFGGRKSYFSSHGNYEFHDYNYAIEQGRISSDYLEWWGFEDEKLFDYAKEELLELAEKDEPFNYTILTADTHFEDGYVCRLCDDEFGENQYANVISCSDRQVSEFVRWLQEQDFYENTTVILCGDHTTMDADFCNDVDDSYQRRVYTAILNDYDGSADTVSRQYSTMDMFPTTLASLGATVDGNQLGLGVNLYSDKQTIIEEYGFDICYDELSMQTSFLDDHFGNEYQANMKQFIQSEADFSVLITETNTGTYRVEPRWKNEFLGEYIVKARVEVLNTKTNKTKKAKLKKSHDEETFAGAVEAKAKVASDLACTIFVTTSDGEEVEATSLENANPLVVISKDNQLTLNYKVADPENFSELLFPTWSSGDQSDMAWYSSTKINDNTWQAVIDLNAHRSGDDVCVSIYGVRTDGSMMPLGNYNY